MSKKLLIVDDEPHIRMLLHQTLEELEDEDVEILSAQDGVEALETIQAQSPDLVFLDVMMPRMNGFDVCDRVKNELKLTSIYIVMLTAKGQESDKQHGESVGADHFMSKPFDPDEVLNKARAVLGC
jgi:two-component system, OmpR family, alkaline phosphatase synthesis response regulator PhoP